MGGVAFKGATGLASVMARVSKTMLTCASGGRAGGASGINCNSPACARSTPRTSSNQRLNAKGRGMGATKIDMLKGIYP